MKICYVPKKFNSEHTLLIANANAICTEYANQGLVLTLRQLYYQFVSRNLIHNWQSEYNRLGKILTDARLAGEMDWDFLIDRTRNEVRNSHWKNPGNLLEQAVQGYRIDLWKGQGVRPIVFIEKDAAIGVIEGVCKDNDVSYMSTRGYMSASERWNAAQRIRYHIENGERVVILHVGDHDPSGLQMTDDITTWLNLHLYKDWSLTHGAGLPYPRTRGMIKDHMRAYIADKQRKSITDVFDWSMQPLTIKRIALSHRQVVEFDLPPNPAKTTDPRFEKYYEETGLTESWELDALEPNFLIGLIQREIDALRDDDKWDEAVLKQETQRQTLAKISKHYTPVVHFVSKFTD